MDRLGLAAGVARADQEVVGVAEHAPQVELDDIHSLLVGRIARDLAGQLLGRISSASASVASGTDRARRCSSRPPRSTRSSIGRPAATRSRTIEEEMSTSGHVQKRDPVRPRAQPAGAGTPISVPAQPRRAPLAGRFPPARPPPGRPARAASPARAMPGSVLAVSAPTMNVSRRRDGLNVWLAGYPPYRMARRARSPARRLTIRSRPPPTPRTCAAGARSRDPQR